MANIGESGEIGESCGESCESEGLGKVFIVDLEIEIQLRRMLSVSRRWNYSNWDIEATNIKPMAH